MRPPICDVCDERLTGEVGGLVRFASRPGDLEWRRRAETDGLVGHPPDTGWFCAEHVDQARSLTAWTYPEAMTEMSGGTSTPDPPIDALVKPPVEPPELTEAEWASLTRHGITDAAPTPRYFNGQTASVVVPIRRIVLGRLVDVLIEAFPRFAAAVGAPEPPPLEHMTNRTWSPMDGAVAPDCPFGDEVRHAAHRGDYEYAVSSDVSYWNDDTASNGSCHLSITQVSKPWLVRLSAGSHDATGRTVSVDSLTLWQPMPDALVAELATVIDALR